MPANAAFRDGSVKTNNDDSSISVWHRSIALGRDCWGFALNEYSIKPRAVLASVNGVEIRRRDYWKVRSVDLVNQVNQYNQFSQMVDASQQQQYITLAQQAADELDGVWGSTS